MARVSRAFHTCDFKNSNSATRYFFLLNLSDSSWHKSTAAINQYNLQRINYLRGLCTKNIFLKKKNRHLNNRI